MGKYGSGVSPAGEERADSTHESEKKLGCRVLLAEDGEDTPCRCLVIQGVLEKGVGINNILERVADAQRLARFGAEQGKGPVYFMPTRWTAG
ncbi:MAG: hypothetical protein ACOC7K_01690 [bacterium]